MSKNSEQNSGFNPQLTEQELMELRQIAILYHGRGRAQEAAAILQLISKSSKGNSFPAADNDQNGMFF